MKKTSVVISLLLIFFVSSYAAQRQFVLFEMGTGTWCGFCPAAAAIVDQMYEEGYLIAISELHTDDSYTCEDSDPRLQTLGINAFPTLLPDGGDEPTYPYTHDILVNTVIQRLAVPSACTISLDIEIQTQQIDVVVNVTRDMAMTLDNPRLQIVVTESHMESDHPNWDELNFVCRDMVPDHLGTDFTMTSETIDLPVTIPIDPSWNLTNVKIIAFVENSLTHNVYQTEQIDLINYSDFPPASHIAAQVEGQEIQLNWNAPTIRDLSGYNVYRNGTLYATTTDTTYTDTACQPLVFYSYCVTALYESPNGESFPTSSVTALVMPENLSPADYTAADSPEQEEYPNNTHPFENSFEDFEWTAIDVTQEGLVGYVNIQCNWNSLDYPSEGSMRITAPDGSDYLVFEPGEIGIVPLNIDVTAVAGESIAGTWIVYIVDSYGDGGHRVTDFQATFYYVDETGTSDNHCSEVFSVRNFPNPFNPTTTIFFNLPVKAEVKLEVFNTRGQKVRTLVDSCLPADRHSFVWDGKDDAHNAVSSGLYFYKISAGNRQPITRKCLLLK